MELSKEMRAQIWRASDWSERERELEGELDQITDPSKRSAYLFELGHLCEYMVPDRARALWAFGRAWQATGRNTPALERARAIYLEIGNLEMVAQLAQVEFKQTSQPDYLAIAGEAWLDAGQLDKAVGVLENALEFRTHDVVLKDALEIAKLPPDRVTAEVDQLVAYAPSAGELEQVRLCVRISRLLWLHRKDDPRLPELLRRGHQYDPEEDRINVLLQLHLEANEQFEDLARLYRRRADATSSLEDSIDLLRQGGMSLAVRFEEMTLAVDLLERALQLGHDNDIEDIPGHLAMLRTLRDAYALEGEAERVLPLCEQAIRGRRSIDEQLSIALFAGNLAWKHAGLRDEAQRYFTAVRGVLPDHPSITAFEHARPGHMHIVIAVPDDDDGVLIDEEEPVDLMALPRANDTGKHEAYMGPDTRTAARVAEFSLPIKFKRAGKERWFSGQSRDFSEVGVFVETHVIVPVDEFVTLQITITSDDEWGHEEHEWEALVLRCEPGRGFAVALVDAEDEFQEAVAVLRTLATARRGS